MKRSIQLAILFAALAAPSPVSADEQSGADAKAKAIAPYVNELTVAVMHIDLTRVAAGPLVETLARFMPEVHDLQGGLRSEKAKAIDQLIQPILRAGGKDVYITVSLGGPGPIPTVLEIIPLSATANEKAIRAAVDTPPVVGPWHSYGDPEVPTRVVRRVGDALVIRVLPMDSLPLEIRSSPRPELTAAFQAAGEGTAQVLLIPPAYTGRVIEELMPQLPKEIGGGPSSVLTRGISWAAVGIDLPPRMALRAVIKSQDAQAAEALQGKWVEVLRLAGQNEDTRRALPKFDKATVLLTPKVEGDRLVLNLDSKTAGIDTLLEAFGASLEKERNMSYRLQSMNKVKQFGLGMLNYHDQHKHFPPASSYAPDGKPLLSWRVYILPYIGGEQLFRQFHLNEPWDSPHNKTLIDKMPADFRAPGSQAEKGKTNYLLPVGNGALYASSRDEPKIRDIVDGMSQTIMLVEVDDQHAVTWTKPQDYSFDPKDPKKGIRSPHEGGFIVAFCDASVQFLNRSIDPKTLAALFTRAGGEVPGPY